MLCSSSPREARRAFLVVVVGLDGGAHRLDLGALGVREAPRERREPLGRLHRHRRMAGDGRRPALGFRHHVIDHRIDQPPAAGLLSRDVARQQHHLHRVRARNDLGQVERAHARNHAVLHLRIAEHGVLGGEAEVAVERERHPHADAIAVQRGDHGLVEGNAHSGDRPHQDIGRHHAPGAVDLLDIRAGAEGLRPRARQDGDPHLAVVGDLLPDRAQPLLGRHVQRIEHLRPVERDHRHAVRPLLQNHRHFNSDCCARIPCSNIGHCLSRTSLCPSFIAGHSRPKDGVASLRLRPGDDTDFVA